MVIFHSHVQLPEGIPYGFGNSRDPEILKKIRWFHQLVGLMWLKMRVRLIPTRKTGYIVEWMHLRNKIMP